MNADVLVDCEGTFATLRQAFPAIHSDADWWLPVNCALLRSGETTVLVDTGAGPKPRAFFPDGDATLLDELAAAGASPEDVDVVVHTHLHVDHVGWTGWFPAHDRPRPRGLRWSEISLRISVRSSIRISSSSTTWTWAPPPRPVAA